MTVEKIAILVKNPSTKKPKTMLPSIQSSKCTKPNSVTKFSVKGGVVPNTKKLTVEKIASLIKKPFIEKPKMKHLQYNLQNAPN